MRPPLEAAAGRRLPAPGLGSALELYSGLGGFAVAVRGALAIRASIDVDRSASRIAAESLDHPHVVRNLESVTAEELIGFAADLWWLSPPCQPFTRRGLGRDDEDPRTASFSALVDRVREVRPPAVALENVPPFQGSRTHDRLLSVLDGAGYEVEQGVVCPTELGIPNHRSRFYLVAARMAPRPLAVSSPVRPAPLRAFLDPEAERDPRLRVDPSLLDRYDRAVDRLDPHDEAAIASTFTSAYGRSPVRSGSYLRCADGGWRRFSPREILRLLGFPDTYRLPPELPLRRAWRLCGNSLSVPAVRVVLGALGVRDGAERLKG